MQSTRRRARGAAGTQINNGQISGVENNTDLSGTKWRGSSSSIGVCQKMLNDPHSRGAVEYIANPLQAGTWRFKPASDSDLDREVARFCDWIFFERLPWNTILRRIVRGYAPSGFKLEEVTDDNRPVNAERFPLHPGRGVGIVPTAFHDRPAWTVDKWVQSKSNTAQIQAVIQQIPGSDAEKGGTRRIPANRLIRFTWDQEGANFEGRAIMRSDYGAWKRRVAFQNYDSMKHERQGLGLPTITLDENANEDDADAADAMAAEIRANARGRLVLPHGAEFEMNAEGGGSDLQGAIAGTTRDSAMNVSAGYMLLGLSGPGSYALGSTQQGQHHLFVAANGDFISDIFNTGLDGWSVVARYVHLNYGPDVTPPKMEVINLPTRDWSRVVKGVNDSVQRGTIIADDLLEAELRDLMQVGPHDPDTARELSMFSWLRNKEQREAEAAEMEAAAGTDDEEGSDDE